MPLDPSAPAVALSGVRRAFGDVVAVDDLTFEVPRGTVTVLLGPNGAGKTTVVRLVTGALHPDAGAVRTLGLDPDARRRGHRDPPSLRRGAGAPGALRPPDRHATTSATRRRSSKSTAADSDRAHRRGGRALRHRRRPRDKVGGYSTGMRARLALARAVLHDPDLLLLDEPTAGLDPESARTVLGLIDEMAEDGKTVLMCTHLLLEAEGLADQVIVMDHGRAIDRRLPRRAHPSLLARGPGGPRRRRPERARGRARPALRDAASSATGRHRRPRPARATFPTSSTHSSRAGARLTRVEPRLAESRGALLRRSGGAP